MGYATQLVCQTQRTIVVLITDFYEGGDERDLVRQTEEMFQGRSEDDRPRSAGLRRRLRLHPHHR